MIITEVYLIIVGNQSSELGAEPKFPLLGVRPLTTNADEDDKRQCYGNNRCSYTATDDHVTVQCTPVLITMSCSTYPFNHRLSIYPTGMNSRP